MINKNLMTKIVKFQVCQMPIIRCLGGVLTPSSHCSIFIETSLAGEAGWENDESIAPLDLTTVYILSSIMHIHV